MKQKKWNGKVQQWRKHTLRWQKKCYIYMQGIRRRKNKSWLSQEAWISGNQELVRSQSGASQCKIRETDTEIAGLIPKERQRS